MRVRLRNTEKVSSDTTSLERMARGEDHLLTRTSSPSLQSPDTSPEHKIVGEGVVRDEAELNIGLVKIREE